MINRISHGDTVIEVGDVLYIPDNIHPVTVFALYQTSDRVRAVVGYGGAEYLIDGGTLLSRVANGVWTTVGKPAFRKGERFRQPSTDTLVTVNAVSERPVLNGFAQPHFQYFVQHIDANGIISYTTLDEMTLSGFEPEVSVIVRPFPTEEPGDNVIDEVEIIIQ